MPHIKFLNLFYKQLEINTKSLKCWSESEIEGLQGHVALSVDFLKNMTHG